MMTRQDQATQTKRDRKSLAKPEPAVVAEAKDKATIPSRLFGGSLGPGGNGSVQAAAARLGYPYLQTTQRHSLAAHIGMVQGNRYLQHVVADLEQTENPEHLSQVRTGVSTTIQRDDDGVAESIASGMEAVGGVFSLRWIFNPINARIASWEAELDRAGEQAEGLPILGRVLLIPISLLFVILSAIVGTLNLLMRLNIVNVELQAAATGVRVAAGQLSREQLIRDARELGEEAWDVIVGGIIGAFDHIKEGIEEGNSFRITQAVGEFVLAALALIGIGRGVASWLRRTPRSTIVPPEPRPTGPASAEAAGRPRARPRGREREAGRRRFVAETVIFDETMARQIRDQTPLSHLHGILTREHFRLHWDLMRRPGDPVNPPAAFIDNSGCFYYDAQRIGLNPEAAWAQIERGRAAELERARAERAARRPAVRLRRAPDRGPAFALDEARARLLRDQSGAECQPVPEEAFLRQLWEQQKRRGDPATPPLAWLNSWGGLIYDARRLDWD